MSTAKEGVTGLTIVISKMRVLAVEEIPSQRNFCFPAVYAVQSPEITQSAQALIQIHKLPVNILFDTSSPTLFTSGDFVNTYKLPVFSAPNFKFRGIVSNQLNQTSDATMIEAKIGSDTIKFLVYIWISLIMFY